MKGLDFTHLPQRKKTYAGANGQKISVVYEGEQYMLKFPVNASLNKEMSYANGCFSEATLSMEGKKSLLHVKILQSLE